MAGEISTDAIFPCDIASCVNRLKGRHSRVGSCLLHSEHYKSYTHVRKPTFRRMYAVVALAVHICIFHLHLWELIFVIRVDDIWSYTDSRTELRQLRTTDNLRIRINYEPSFFSAYIGIIHIVLLVLDVPDALLVTHRCSLIVCARSISVGIVC